MRCSPIASATTSARLRKMPPSTLCEPCAWGSKICATPSPIIRPICSEATSTAATLRRATKPMAAPSKNSLPTAAATSSIELPSSGETRPWPCTASVKSTTSDAFTRAGAAVQASGAVIDDAGHAHRLERESSRFGAQQGIEIERHQRVTLAMLAMVRPV
ncbi:MAG: hypothetical protein QM756_31065 [Polyangiaceae bacterium]